MTDIAFSRNTWAELERDEARFQRILLLVAIPFIIFGIVIPLWELAGLKEGGGEELSDRYAELLLQSAAQEQESPEPEPATVEEPAEEPEPEPEPEPESAPEQEQQPAPKPEPVKQVDARQQARENVQKKFASAFNALDSLRDQAPVVAANNRPLTAASSTSDEPVESSSGVLTSNLASGSGGVGAAPSRSTRPNTTGLKGRQTINVNSGIKASGGGFGGDKSKAGFGGDSRLQGRSLEEIQIVMDRNKSGLYSLYNRALRKDATLQGKVVLEITIAPSGAVTVCRIASSQLNNKALEDRIARRVKLINFGAKDVSEMTIKYPIHFIPS